MKRNNDKKIAIMTKDPYNNDSMIIAGAITATLKLWKDQEWMKVESQLYTAVKSVLYKTELAKSISFLMRETPRYVVDEVVSKLKIRLIADDMKLLRHFADKPNGDFTRWAAVNARYYALRMYNSVSEESSRVISDEDDIAINQSSMINVEDAFISRENYQFVMASISNLPEEQRVSLTMKISEEYGMLSNKELSEMLGVNENAFNKRIHDARKNIRKMYA